MHDVARPYGLAARAVALLSGLLCHGTFLAGVGCMLVGLRPRMGGATGPAPLGAASPGRAADADELEPAGTVRASLGPCYA